MADAAADIDESEVYRALRQAMMARRAILLLDGADPFAFPRAAAHSRFVHFLPDLHM